MNKIILWAVALLFSTGLFASTPITYQGYLELSGESYSGPPVAMLFRLFGSESGTDQIGQNIGKTVSVSGGLFQVELDFGLEAFDGQPRFLEVTVDSHTISPRTALASTPYAIRAATASIAEHATTAGSAATLGTLGPDDVLPKGSTLSCNATTQKITAVNPTTGDVTCATDQGLNLNDCSWVNGEAVSFTSNVVFATVTCPAGQVAISGGWAHTSWVTARTCIVRRSDRTPAGDGWVVEMYSPPNDCVGNAFRASALCCTP